MKQINIKAKIADGHFLISMNPESLILNAMVEITDFFFKKDQIHSVTLYLNGISAGACRAKILKLRGTVVVIWPKTELTPAGAFGIYERVI